MKDEIENNSNEGFMSRWSKRKSIKKSDQVNAKTSVDKIKFKNDEVKEQNIVETEENDEKQYDALNDQELLDKFKLPDPEKIKTTLEQTGFVFLFAPFFHPAMKNIAPIRQALGVRTVFNILGPLTNPAQPNYYLLGAFSSKMAKLMAEALSGMSIKRAFIIHGANGWDEPTPISEFELYDVSPGRVDFSTREPQDFGIPRCKASDLLGGDSTKNATALMDVFKGIDQGAHLNSLLLGTGLALELSGKAINLEEGITQARNAIEQGTALDLIQKLQTLKD